MCFQRRSGLHSAGQDVQCRSGYAVQSSTELHSAAPQAVVSVSSAVQIRLAEKARANPNPSPNANQGSAELCRLGWSFIFAHLPPPHTPRCKPKP